jgi:glycerophosphoryl diester phosphodiesterase
MNYKKIYEAHIPTDEEYYDCFWNMYPETKEYKDHPEIKKIADEWVVLSKEIDVCNKKRRMASTAGEKAGLTKRVTNLKNKQIDLIYAPLGLGGIERTLKRIS